ncbi:MAG TPA: hypothetical protein VN937_27210 [Blastocatellia bacterium]|nr:hypothetical protein [Blastocatellia bacterium]
MVRIIPLIEEWTTDDADLTDQHGYDGFHQQYARYKQLVAPGWNTAESPEL